MAARRLLISSTFVSGSVAECTDQTPYECYMQALAALEEAKKDYDTIKSNYDELETKYDELGTKYDELGTKYEALKSDAEKTNVTVADVDAKYEALTAKHTNEIAYVHSYVDQANNFQVGGGRYKIYSTWLSEGLGASTDSCQEKNPLTNDCSCPKGFSAVFTGENDHRAGNHGSHQMIYLCQKTVSAKSPGKWTRHPGANCYPDHGAKDMEPTPGTSLGTMKLAECEAKCEETAGCGGITVSQADSSGLVDCYRRAEIVIADCDSDAAYDTWVLSHPQSVMV